MFITLFLHLNVFFRSDLVLRMVMLSQIRVVFKVNKEVTKTLNFLLISNTT